VGAHYQGCVNHFKQITPTLLSSYADHCYSWQKKRNKRVWGRRFMLFKTMGELTCVFFGKEEIKNIFISSGEPTGGML